LSIVPEFVLSYGMYMWVYSSGHVIMGVALGRADNENAGARH
jgi:hypothetical protein